TISSARPPYPNTPTPTSHNNNAFNQSHTYYYNPNIETELETVFLAKERLKWILLFDGIIYLMYILYMWTFLPITILILMVLYIISYVGIKFYNSCMTFFYIIFNCGVIMVRSYIIYMIYPNVADIMFVAAGIIIEIVFLI